MNRIVTPLAAALLAMPVTAQEPAPSPNQIVEQANPEEWIAIPPEDLLVMTLAPTADGTPRQVVIQLMPAPFSQEWVENIRTLARTRWYDGVTVNRVQDNYVVQWGDPNYDNPEGDGEAKPLPEGLRTPSESDYVAPANDSVLRGFANGVRVGAKRLLDQSDNGSFTKTPEPMRRFQSEVMRSDPYSIANIFRDGWPVSISFGEEAKSVWPLHCYGMVGVGRGMSPDTGSGAELYTVIGHAPRHLDRNIALVGRIVNGMEHLSSLPRGSGALGFYTTEEAGKRTPILSIRVATDLADSPGFKYLSTESETFERYAEARANRRDPFFIVPAGGADICNIPVPVRRVVD